MLKGVDVSAHNGVIDWKKVKNGGIDFVMIRAGYGGTVDARFKYNVEQATKNSIKVGVYWFSYALNTADARREANLCLKTIEKYKIDFPVAFDFEYDSVNYAARKGVTITKQLASQIADTFLSIIRNAGYIPINYTNVDYINRYFTPALTKKYDLWLACWSTNKTKPTKYPTLSIWQHDVLGTQDQVKKGWAHAIGSVRGITGAIDVNYCYKDYSSTQSYINKVQSRCNPPLEQQTIDYINKYEHSKELWKRLSEMK